MSCYFPYCSFQYLVLVLPGILEESCGLALPFSPSVSLCWLSGGAHIIRTLDVGFRLLVVCFTLFSLSLVFFL